MSTPNAIVLDPFVGTGTTGFVASSLKRRSIGIDLSKEYLEEAERRCSIFGILNNGSFEKF